MTEHEQVAIMEPVNTDTTSTTPITDNNISNNTISTTQEDGMDKKLLIQDTVVNNKEDGVKEDDVKEDDGKDGEDNMQKEAMEYVMEDEDSELEPLQQATLEEQRELEERAKLEQEKESDNVETNTKKEEDEAEEENNTKEEEKVEVVEKDLPAAEPEKPNLEPSQTPLPDHQHKYATTSIRNIKRLKDAKPFLVPVDPVALKIPQYYQHIKKPMDISLIEKKLNLKVYSDIEEFYEDFKLMVNNCILFNGEKSGIAVMASNLLQSFQKHMNNMPPREIVKKSTTNSTTNTGASTGTESKKNITSNSSSGQSQVDRGDVKTEPVVGVVVVGGVGGVGGGGGGGGGGGVKSEQKEKVVDLEKEASLVGRRSKRQIHPPKTKDLYYNEITKAHSKPKDKNLLQDLNFAKSVVKDLMSKKYTNINFPFIEPVDPVALNLPTYFDYVKKPMDLGTISKKLNNWEYKSFESVEEDINLVFHNCFIFNPKGTVVNDWGVQLQAIFKNLWSKRPSPLPPTPEPVVHYEDDDMYDDEDMEGMYDDEDDDMNNSGALESSDEEIDEASITTPAIQFMEQQLVQIQQELKKLRKIEIDKMKKSRKSAKRNLKQKMIKRKSQTGKRRSAGANSAASNGSVKRRRKSSNTAQENGSGGMARKRSKKSNGQVEVVVTYEMKKYMAEKMEHLSSSELEQISTFVQTNIDLESLPKDELGEWVFDLNHFPNDLILTLFNTFFKKYNEFHHGVVSAPSAVSNAGVANSSNLSSNNGFGSGHSSFAYSNGVASTPAAFGSAVSTPAADHSYYAGIQGASSMSPLTNPTMSNTARRKSRSGEAEKIVQIKQKLELLNAAASPSQSLNTPTSSNTFNKNSVQSMHGFEDQAGESSDDYSSDESEEE